MRITATTVAVLATAAMLSSLASPAMAGKKGGGNNFFDNLGSMFDSFGGGGDGYKPPKYNGPSFGGGGHGGGSHGGKKGSRSYTDNPGSPASSPTNTIVYFGTCLNLAGYQQAGNAAEDGYCVPFESLVGNEGGPGSGPTCTVTTTKKSHGGGSMGYARGSGNGGETTTTETVNGTCAAYEAANPSNGHDKPGHGDDEEEETSGS